MLEIRMLPARQGDAIWIRWGDCNTPFQMIIDMGTESVGEKIHEQLKNLNIDNRCFELLVITHVDGDHIGGVLTCLADNQPLEGLEFKDVWFNGWVHLDGGQVSRSLPLITPTNNANENQTIESFGPAQGERLSSWLQDQSWNTAFDGKPVCRVPGATPSSITLAGGLKLTILSPTPERLSKFKPIWEEEVRSALEKGRLKEVSLGLESYGSTLCPVLNDFEDLANLTDSSNSTDTSEANGSSISLLLEYMGCRVVLAGDAFAADIIDGLNALGHGEKLEIDAFKLPHHGSKNNINRELIESVSCPRWLFSTDGTQFKHPDATAVARVIRYTPPGTSNLIFNVPSTYNLWWNNTAWKEKYKYNAVYGNPHDGYLLNLLTNENDCR